MMKINSRWLSLYMGHRAQKYFSDKNGGDPYQSNSIFFDVYSIFYMTSINAFLNDQNDSYIKPWISRASSPLSFYFLLKAFVVVHCYQHLNELLLWYVVVSISISCCCSTLLSASQCVVVISISMSCCCGTLLSASQ